MGRWPGGRWAILSLFFFAVSKRRCPPCPHCPFGTADSIPTVFSGFCRKRMVSSLWPQKPVQAEDVGRKSRGDG